MTKERLEINYNISVDTLTWETGHNNLFQYVILGPYCIYHDASGYYVTRDNSVLQWTVDLSKYLK